MKAFDDVGQRADCGSRNLRLRGTERAIARSSADRHVSRSVTLLKPQVSKRFNLAPRLWWGRVDATPGRTNQELGRLCRVSGLEGHNAKSASDFALWFKQPTVVVFLP